MAGFALLRVSPLGGLRPSAGFGPLRVTPLCGFRPSAGYAPLRVSPLCGFRPCAGLAPWRVSLFCGFRPCVGFRSSAGFALVRFSPLCGLNNAKSPDAGYRRRQICPEVFCCWRRSRSLKRCNLHITLKTPYARQVSLGRLFLRWRRHLQYPRECRLLCSLRLSS